MSARAVWRERWRGVLLAVAIIVCTGPALHAQDPLILRRIRVDPDRLVDFHASVSPETLFVGQQATYQVAVLLDEVAGARLPRNPEYLPPELRGLLAYDLGGQQRFSHTANGKRYTAYVFQKALFPLAAGRFTIPPPQLTYSLRQSSSYFSREESHTLRAESSTVVVRPLPDENRPADFTGAVGVLKSTVRLDTATARVGDPLVLTLRVQGSGNIKLLPRPTLELEWATAVPGTERLQMDTSGAVVRGAKEFDWILTPTRAGGVVTPELQYTFFNPISRAYEVAAAEPVAFAVAAGSLAGREEREGAAAALPLRRHDVGNVPEPLLDRWVVWAALALFPLPALALVVLGVPRKRPVAPPIDALRAITRQRSPAATVRTVGSTDAPPTTARDVRRLLLASLARRLGVPSDVITERSRTRRVLRRRGVTPETTDELLAHLSTLDVAAFAATNAEYGAVTAELSAAALALYDRVDKEALELASPRGGKARGDARAARVIVIALALASAVPGVIRAQAGSTWERAVQAYQNRQFVDAASLFSGLAEESPRDADVLANWGTAAWAAGDTVHAVIGWQRAVRLDPLAADLREQLLLLPSGSRDGVAEVPLIPVSALGIAGVLLWMSGWTLAAFLLWRKRASKRSVPALNTLATGLVLLGTAGVAGSAWGAQQLRATGLAVVLRPETIRSGPEGGADALGGAATGDMVRVQGLQALWARVEHSDGRTGWMPATRLAPLAGTLQP